MSATKANSGNALLTGDIYLTVVDLTLCNSICQLQFQMPGMPASQDGSSPNPSADRGSEAARRVGRRLL
jgi:hypothetical protein